MPIAQRTEPVVHRLLCGELKHHYLLKSGALACQKAPLTAHSGKQRLGYQLLIDDTGDSAFLDLYEVSAEGGPRLGPLTFLTLAWTAPTVCARYKRRTGLPQVLLCSPKDFPEPLLDTLVRAGSALGFRVEHPGSGFAAGVSYVRLLNKTLSRAAREPGADGVDWRRDTCLNLLSHGVAGEIAWALTCSRPRLYTRPLNARYVRGKLPPDLLESVARKAGCSSWAEYAHELCPAFFDAP